MLTLLILISRYIFFGLAAGFLFFCALPVLAAKGYVKKTNTDKCGERQRMITIVFHVLAFTILALKHKDAQAFTDMVFAGCGGLALLAASYRFFKAPFFNCAFFLFDVGFIMITRLNPRLGERQLLNAIAGLACMAVFTFLYKYAGRVKKICLVYMSAGAALAALPFFIGAARYGALNWIIAGPFSFQPSELVKLLFVLYLAEALPETKKTKELIAPSVYGAFLTGVLALQRDLGGALILFVIFITMLYVKSGAAMHAACAAGAAVVGCAVAYYAYPALFNHVAVRVAAWTDPWRVIDSGGYQLAQSLFAVGTWGVLGSGLTRGYPNRIPVVEKDFIFPAISEEFGVIFGVLLILIFVSMIYFGFTESARVKNNVALTTGLLCALAFQCFLSIGGNIRLIPHTGVTLPFVSYGGSSLVACMAMAALTGRGDP